MMKRLILAILVVSMGLIAFNCEKDSSGIEPKEPTGKLSVLLTDASAAYDSVIITFSEISAHIDNEWVSVMHEPISADLLEWSNGRTLLLGSSDVPAGKYTQIRIQIDSAEIGVDGLVYPLDVPSGAQTGLKLGPEFTITEGSTYELVMDFDVNRSIVMEGSGDFKLKPRIRVISNAVTGSISGTVLNHEHLPVSYAISGTDTVTSSVADTSDGSFLLSFLPETTYKVLVADTINQRYQQEGVSVAKGQNNHLGDITLQ